MRKKVIILIILILILLASIIYLTIPKNEKVIESDFKTEDEIISKTEPYVGYYADVNADGTVDGVIYADLAVGNTGDGEWGTTR